MLSSVSVFSFRYLGSCLLEAVPCALRMLLESLWQLEGWSVGIGVEGSTTVVTLRCTVCWILKCCGVPSAFSGLPAETSPWW